MPPTRKRKTIPSPPPKRVWPKILGFTIFGTFASFVLYFNVFLVSKFERYFDRAFIPGNELQAQILHLMLTRKGDFDYAVKAFQEEFNRKANIYSEQDLLLFIQFMLDGISAAKREAAGLESDQLSREDLNKIYTALHISAHEDLESVRKKCRKYELENHPDKRPNQTPEQLLLFELVHQHCVDVSRRLGKKKKAARGGSPVVAARHAAEEAKTPKGGPWYLL